MLLIGALAHPALRGRLAPDAMPARPLAGYALTAAPQAGIAVGEPLAYLIAPPLEALIGIDAALKVGGVTLKKFFGPPTETNFAGAYLAGDLPSCEAAAEAFAAAVLDVARSPLQARGSARGSGELLGPRPRPADLGSKR